MLIKVGTHVEHCIPRPVIDKRGLTAKVTPHQDLSILQMQRSLLLSALEDKHGTYENFTQLSKQLFCAVHLNETTLRL